MKIKHFIVFLLITIVLLLIAILFKDKINWYFKSQEILKKASVLNIPEVAVVCYKSITDEIPEMSQECMDKMDEYREKEILWKNLINEYRNIDCKDFVNKEDAAGFYNWISGELVMGFYTYRNFVKGKEPDTDKFAFMASNKFDGHCRYDPYGLDADGDCNACENYGLD